MRLIDADALIEKFEKAKESSKLQDIAFLCGAQAVVDSMPTIEVNESTKTVNINKVETFDNRKTFK